MLAIFNWIENHMIPFKSVTTERLKLPLFFARLLVYLVAVVLLLTIPMGMSERQLISPFVYLSSALPGAIVTLAISCLIASLVSIDDALRRNRN